MCMRAGTLENETENNHDYCSILDEYTFDNFIVVESNKFVYDTVLAVAEKTINPHYNPLYIYGKSGLGKTHLLHAVRQRVEEKYPDRKVIYVRSGDFAEELVLSIKEEKRNELRTKYSSIDILLIDDTQNLAGKPVIQQELRNIYDTLREKGAQIIITSDKSVTDMYEVTDTLRTRFISGLQIEIHPPDITLHTERVELHCHTKMSAMAGVVSAGDLVRHAKKLGHKAVAITDHGSVQAFPKAYRASKETGVKVIYGAEVYIENKNTPKKPYLTTLLVKNQKGLRNLYELITLLNTSFVTKPELTKDILNFYREGLLVGSSGGHGELQKEICNNCAYDRLIDIAGFYDYFELHPNDFKETNKTIIQICKELDKPVIATGNVRYLNYNDHIALNILLSLKDSDESKSGYYFRTTDEMLKAFDFLSKEKAYEVVITNTNKIADMVEEVSPLPKWLYYPEIKGAEEELMEISKARFHELYDDNPYGEASKRLYAEFNGIVINGFASIYMIAKRLVDYAQNKGYQISTRGSCGSSFVAYLLGITEIDPLEYDIPFEVFAGYEVFSGADYKKAPDFDFNLCKEGQEAVSIYLEEMFGKDKVIRAGTTNTINDMKAYSIISVYCKENDISIESIDVDYITSLLCGVRKTHTGVHPGGFYIIPEHKEIYDFTPVGYPANDPERGLCTHFSHIELDSVLCRFDILGHDNQTRLQKLAEITCVNVNTIKFDDEKTLELFEQADTCGIPEFGTVFARKIIEKVKPKCFNDYIKILGLCHGMDVWHDNAELLIESGAATLNNIISTRDEVMCYLMEKGIGREIAFTIMEDLRKGKGLSDDFAKMMHKANIPDWYISSCKKISYLFPKAHAVSYAMTAFRIAWFKAHYPVEFYTVSLEVASYGEKTIYLNYDKPMVESELEEIKTSSENSGFTFDISNYNNLILRQEMLDRGF